MKLNNISFPYPVLRCGNDDILPALPVDCFTINKKEDTLMYYFEISLKFENPDIEALIEKGKALYTCEIDCIKTVWRQTFWNKDSTFTIEIPRKDLSGNVTFSAYVSVRDYIKDYRNKGFNPDYEDATFNLEPGDILVGFPVIHHHVDIKYDKLQAAGSFMKICEDVNNKEVSYNFEHDKIEINLPTEMFKLYQNGLKSNFAEIMHSTLAFNALTCALYELPNLYDETGGDLLWIQALTHRLESEEQFKDEMNDKHEIHNVFAVANKLLRNPYKRLFNNLTEQITNDTEELHG